MAKRKSKAKTTKSFAFAATSALLGIVALIMLFCPTIGIKDSDTTYTGLQVTFGHSESALGVSIEVFGFSFMNLLGYLLVAAGVVFAVMTMFGKDSKGTAFLSAVAFVVAGLLLFLSKSFVQVNEDATSLFAFFGGDIKNNLTLAYGAIVGAIASLLAGIVQLVKIFAK